MAKIPRPTVLTNPWILLFTSVPHLSAQLSKVVDEADGREKCSPTPDAIISRSSFCTASTMSFSPDSLDESDVPVDHERVMAQEQPVSGKSKNHICAKCEEDKMGSCVTPETMISTMGTPSDREDGKVDECHRKVFSPASYHDNSDEFGSSTNSGIMEFEFDVNSEFVPEERNQNKFCYKVAQTTINTKRTHTEKVQVVHYSNPFDDIKERKPPAKHLVESKKQHPLRRTTPEKKVQIQKKSDGNKIFQKHSRTSDEVSKCPAAQLLAQLKKNEIHYDICQKDSIIPSNQRGLLKKPETVRNRSPKQKNLTEVELFMPQLTLSKGHVVFDCSKLPIIKKRILSPRRSSASSSKRIAEANAKEEAMSMKFPCVQTTVTKINEALTNTIKELKQKVDELLTTGKTAVITENVDFQVLSPQIPAVPFSPHGHKDRSQEDHCLVSVTGKKSIRCTVSPRNYSSNVKKDWRQVACKDKTNDNYVQQKPKQRAPSSFSSSPKHKMPTKMVVEGVSIQEQKSSNKTVEVAKNKDVRSKPSESSIMSEIAQPWSCHLEQRNMMQKSYKQMYLEKAALKGSTWKMLKAQNMEFDVKSPLSKNLLTKLEEENRPRFRSKVADESWIHRVISHTDQIEVQSPDAKSEDKHNVSKNGGYRHVDSFRANRNQVMSESALKKKSQAKPQGPKKLNFWRRLAEKQSTDDEKKSAKKEEKFKMQKKNVKAF